MARSLLISPQFSETDGAARLVLTVTAPGVGNTADPNVFLYLKVSDDPEQAVVQCVCSPLDLTTYPADAPDPDIDPPFFRLNQIDIIDVEIRLRELLANLHLEIGGLLARLDALDVLVAEAPVTVGGT